MNDTIPPALAVTFGRLLATWRKVNGITATDFARDAGLADKYAVCRIERAAVLLAVGEYARLCAHIGADASGSFAYEGYVITVRRTFR